MTARCLARFVAVTPRATQWHQASFVAAYDQANDQSLEEGITSGHEQWLEMSSTPVATRSKLTHARYADDLPQTSVATTVDAVLARVRANESALQGLRARLNIWQNRDKRQILVWLPGDGLQVQTLAAPGKCPKRLCVHR